MRSIAVTITTSDAGFSLSVTEKESVTDKDLGQSHVEKESSSQDFSIYKSAVDAAGALFRNFEKKLGKPDGELFG